MKKKVLLVEDNADNAAATAELLRAHGYDVHVAVSVQSALAAAGTRFDVVVSDIGLPDGSGRDVIRGLSSHGPVPSIALSGFGTDDDVRRNQEAGFSRHLTKPVDPDELVAAVAELTAPPPAAAVSGRSRRLR